MLERFLFITVLLALAAAPARSEEDPLADEHAQDQIAELSSANRLLFTDSNLASITSPAKLIYNFSQKGELKDFVDTVELNINRIYENGRRDISFRYLKGRNKVRFPPQLGVRSNPLFMLFFERDAREMQNLTGGNALFFRNRIRHALAAEEAEPVKFKYQGRQVEGMRIKIRPFVDSDLTKRFPKYEEKTYELLLSKEVPGAIYQLRAFVPQKGDKKVNLSDEILVFAEMRSL